MNDEDWYARNRIFHYTKSIETVASILARGFLLVPNRRQLAERFLPGDDFAAREPQQFGMVSFTELPVDRATSHRERFGAFGICVSWNWAVRHDAQRVIYLDDCGIVFDRFKWLFELGRQQLGSAPTSLETTNKAMAAVSGAQLYHAMLTLYEYMETSRNSTQVEWRIVNKLPVHHADLADRAWLLEHLIKMSHVSPMGSVAIAPDDVEMFVCPRGDVDAVRRALPSGFEAVPIFSYTRGSSFTSWADAAFQWVAELRKRRDRVVRVPYEPRPGSLLLPMADDVQVVMLPDVARMNGLTFLPDAVHGRAFVRIQYEDRDRRWFELRMSTGDAAYLLELLRQMTTEPRFQQSITSASAAPK